MYQQTRLSDLSAIGAPGPLPDVIATWGDALDLLADLTGHVDPQFGFDGTGFWPVIVALATYDPAKQVLAGGVTGLAVDAANKRWTATEAVRDLTAGELAANLAAAQQAKIAELSTACAAQIVGGYTSSALGSAYTYPSKPTDQANMTASVTDAQRTPPSWQASTSYRYMQDVMVGSVRLIATVAGISGGTAPTGPGADGGVTWAAWFTPFWVEDASGVWSWHPHSEAQIQAAGADGKIAILTAQAKNATLAAEVMAATTVAAVNAITW